MVNWLDEQKIEIVQKQFSLFGLNRSYLLTYTRPLTDIDSTVVSQTSHFHFDFASQCTANRSATKFANGTDFTKLHYN